MNKSPSAYRLYDHYVSFVRRNQEKLVGTLALATVATGVLLAPNTIGTEQLVPEQEIPASKGDTLNGTIGEVCPEGATNYEASGYKSHIETAEGQIVSDPSNMQIGDMMVINCMGNK